MQPTQLGRREVVSYSSIGFAQTLLSGMVSSYLIYYYTDVLMLAASNLAWIVFIARFFDGAIDPFIGHYMDKGGHPSGKYGRYISTWALPMCASFLMLFLPIYPDGGLSLSLLCLATYILFGFAYSMVSESSLGLLVTISDEKKHRNSLNSAKVFGSVLATVVVRYVVLEIVKLMGNGGETRGFMVCAILFAAISLPLLLLGRRGIKERNNLGSNPYTLFGAGKLLAKDKTLILLLAFFMCTQLASGVKSPAVLYYFKYNLGNQDFTATFQVVGVLSSLAAQPLILAASRRVSHHKLITAGFLGGAASIALMHFAGTSIALITGAHVLYGLFSAFPANLVYICVADRADYYARNGQNHTALISSLLGLTSKLGASLAGALTGVVLNISDYQANQVQSAEAMGGIWASFIALPAALYLIAAVISIAYGRQVNRLDETGDIQCKKQGNG